MKNVVLFIDGKTSGPFPLDEVEARFAAGELPAETPCAEPGATEWKTLGDFVSAGKKPAVRIARKTREEEAEMKKATSEKLDPELRKKLLLYNLADAVSVDKFTPLQAEAAVKLHEEALKKDKKKKIAAGVGGFVVAALLTGLLVEGVKPGTAPGGKSLRIFESLFMAPPNETYVRQAKRVATEARQLETLRAEAAAERFAAPRGQPSRQFFLNNVEIANPDVSTVTGTLDASALAGTLPANLTQTATFEIIQLSRLDGATEELIRRQNALFADCAAPLWTDADLRRAIAEMLEKNYPRTGTDVSEEIEKRLLTFRIENMDAQLHWLEKRLQEISTSQAVQNRMQGRMKDKFEKRSKATTRDEDGADRIAERQAETRRVQDWASREMPRFLEKIKKFLAENELHYSAPARAQAWETFVADDLPRLVESVEKNAEQRVPVAGNGAFVLDGRTARRIVAVAHFAGAGDVYYVPAGTASGGAEDAPVVVRDMKTNRKTLTPEDVLMDERYAVTAKEKVGGVPVMTSGKLLGEDIYVVRTTPEWFYVTVGKVADPDAAQQRRRPSVVLGVPAEFFASVNVGDEVPMEKLLAFERFSRPAESPVGGRLSLIPEDKLEAVKAQQEEAGLAFPPPPEIYAPEPPPPAEKKDAAETPDAEEEGEGGEEENAAAAEAGDAAA